MIICNAAVTTDKAQTLKYSLLGFPVTFSPHKNGCEPIKLKSVPKNDILSNWVFARMSFTS